MKIIQLTDLHIGKEGEHTADVDVRSNFLNLLNTVQATEPDLLVISGDLCYDDGDAETYQWILEQLKETAIPFLAIPGNHDDSKLLATGLELDILLKKDELYFVKKWGDWTCLFLDSAIGTMSDEQYTFIANELTKISDKCLVFIHHPSAYCGVPFMDKKYSFQEMEKLQSAFSNYSGTLNIFCGHYHVHKTTYTHNQIIHISPSSFFQIDQHSSDFKVDHYRIGYREIELHEGRLETSVHYL